jgi:hypothetical protein
VKPLVAIILVGLLVPCAASGQQESGSASPAQNGVGITAMEVCEVLRTGGLDLTSSVSEIPIDPWDAMFEVPGLVSKAVGVTATERTDVSVEVFDSEASRAAEQRRRNEDWERLRASRKPGALPDLMPAVACGPILIRLEQVSSSAIGIQQRKQVVEILKERFGPCS